MNMCNASEEDAGGKSSSTELLLKLASVLAKRMPAGFINAGIQPHFKVDIIGGGWLLDVASLMQNCRLACN